ncbi:MAG: hypothetical protein WCC17_09505 [Candidatus Nitrosopolaris sp.]
MGTDSILTSLHEGHTSGHATTAVADSMGDTFRQRGLQGQYHDYTPHQQQAPSPLIPLPPPSVQDVLPYPHPVSQYHYAKPTIDRLIF